MAIGEAVNVAIRGCGVLEAVARIVQLGGKPQHAPAVATLRAAFQARTGAFAPDDPWYEERIRAFWCDAVTGGRLGRRVEAELTAGERAWQMPLERTHRGLFRLGGEGAGAGALLIDVWSGVALEVGVMDDASRAELDASSGQLLDGRVLGADDPFTVALLPGAVFHPRDATPHIAPVLAAARSQGLSTTDTLDALLRMHRARSSLSRVKPAYAYRAEALSPQAPVLPHAVPRRPVRSDPREPT